MLSDPAERCKKCASPVSRDEIAVTKKLINRGTTEYMCIRCLAAYFEVKESDIEERIAYFRRTGCTLFEQTKESST